MSDALARLTFEEQLSLTEEEETLQYWLDNPVEAQKDIIGYELNWFQRIMLKNFWFKQFNLWVHGRGSSKTFMISLCAALWACTHPNYKIGITAPVFRQANFVFDEIERIYNNSEMFRACCKGPVSRTMERSVLRFTNGSFIEGLPLGDGTKVRGRRYNILFADEYAQMPEKIMQLVVFPFLMIQTQEQPNKLIRASSAYWQHNHLWPLYVKFRIDALERPDTFAVTEFNYRDILADKKNKSYVVDEEMVKQMANELTQDEFAMELLAKFPAGSMGFFSAQLIDKSTRKFEPIEVELTGDPNAEYVIGVDVARQADNFAIVILKIVGQDKHVVRAIAYNKITYQKMAKVIRQVCYDYNVIKIIMDKGGGGDALADLLEERVDAESMIQLPIIQRDADRSIDGLRMLTLLKTSMPINERLFTKAKAEMEHGRLIFPVNIRSHSNTEIAEAYRQIMLLKTEMGVIEEVELQNGKQYRTPKKYHKDRVSAFVMANGEACDYISETFRGEHEVAQGFWA